MKKIAVVIGLIACSSAFSSPSKLLWQDAQSKLELQQKQIKETTRLKKRSLSLNEQGLKELLAGDQLKLALRPTKSYQPELDLPLPNGDFVRVRAIESPILSPQIAEQHPEIKTWRVEGVDDPSISGRLDFTIKGFHGMLSMPDGDVVYIDPDKKSAGSLYQSLSKRENRSHFKTDFDCKLHDDHALLSNKTGAELAGKKLAQIPALDLITYRLAVAGTAEYTASQGGSSASAYASMITTINRVSQLYQSDLGVKLEIVSNDSLAYTDAATDPYTNNNANSLVTENIQNINNKVGAANYDIGHVFAQGPLGGLAYVGAVCQENYKAGGATGINDPQGEVFSIEYVAHEMGHQLGAHHTFNSQKNACSGTSRTQGSAVEPGSGSTVMSYSGLCGTDNLQYGSDAMFHWKSISEINNYTRSAAGSSCGNRASAGSQKPSVNAGANAVIPLDTPFLLDGSATGGSTYSWDQKDTGSASAVDVDLGNNAIIRSLLPSFEPDRYIPRLSDLFAGSHTIGEKLPQTVRDLNFAFVVRNGSGGIGTDFKKISVKDTGARFRVLSQSSAQTLLTGQVVDVAWNVAATDVSPINCGKVNIQLLRENGVKNTLLLNTNNDGSEQITVPASTPVMSNARLMVACSSQPFFQISAGKIAIKKGSSDTTAPVITIKGSANISILQGKTYNDAGATALDNKDGAINVVVKGSVNTAKPGSYSITYTAIDAAGNKAVAIRTVTVKAAGDSIAPVITLKGASVIEIIKGAKFTDPGATASDNVDKIVSVKTSGKVDTNVLGVYSIFYTATDAAGNKAMAKSRTIKVVAKVTPDTKAPVILLFGAQTINIVQGSTYKEPGASALDEKDGVVDVVISGTVNTNKIGSYTISYTAQDAAGNKAPTKHRIVKVVSKATPDKTPPTITLKGDAKVTIKLGADFKDPGFKAFDDRDDIVKVVVKGTVDTSVAGTYYLTYVATDRAGNTFEKKRIVIVAKKNDSGEHADTKSSGGGSFGFLLLPLAIVGWRKRKM